MDTPLRGTVFGKRIDTNVRGFGAAVALFHVVRPGVHFYTIYGHLNPEDVKNLWVGRTLREGRAFARVGSPEENGGWPAHLHWQVSLDMMGQRDVFFGAGHDEEWPMWRTLFPDPELLLR